MLKKTVGLCRIVNAGKYSIQGLHAAFKSEAAFRQETFALAIALAVCIIIDFSLLEKMLLVGSVIFVMIIELINSAIEAIVDRIGSEYHKLSGQAKDIGSAAVLLALIIAAMIWGYIFYCHFV